MKLSLRKFFLFLLYISGAVQCGDLVVFIGGSVVFVISLAMADRNESPHVSLYDLCLILFVYFYSLSPMVVCDSGQFLVGPNAGIQYSQAEVITGFGMVICSQLVLLLVAGRNGPRRPDVMPEGGATFQKMSPAQSAIARINVPSLVALSVVSLISFIALTGGIEEVMRPRLEQDIRKGQDTLLNSLAAIALSLGSAGCAMVIYALKSRMNGGSFAGLLTLLASMVALASLLVCVNPFNSSRFMIVGTYFPCLVAAFGWRLKISHFIVMAIVGMFIVFPVLSVTTRTREYESLDLLNWLALSQSAVLELDPFAMVVHGVRFFDENSLRCGDALMASVLFFIPRALWIDKPYVSSYAMGDQLTQIGSASINNLSCPFFLEGYADFGFAGVIAYSALFFWAIFYFERRGRWSDSMLWSWTGAAVVGFYPIIFRGAIGSSVGPAIAYVFCAVLLWFLFVRKYEKAVP